MIASISSPVPTGTVDLVTTTVKPSSSAAISSAAAIDVGQVGMAVAAPRGRADGDEHRVGLAHRRSRIGGEGQPACAHVARHQLLQARLVDRHHAGLQPRDLPASLSMQVTSWPKSAKQAPDTRPT